MFLESIEMGCPELAIGRQPVVKIRQGLGSNSVQAALGIGPDVNEARFLKDAEMFGDRWLAETEALDELADGPLVFAEELEDGQPARLTKNLEQGRLSHKPKYSPRAI